MQTVQLLNVQNPFIQSNRCERIVHSQMKRSVIIYSLSTVFFPCIESQWGPKQKKSLAKYHLLCSIEGRNACRFETTWGWSKLWHDFQFWENYLISTNGTNPFTNRTSLFFPITHLKTDPHIRQIHLTVSLCPIVTQGLEKPSEHASQTLGKFLLSSVMAYFGFQKESGEKQNSMRLVWQFQRQRKKMHYGIIEAKLPFTAWLTVPVHSLLCFPTPR